MLLAVPISIREQPPLVLSTLRGLTSKEFFMSPRLTFVLLFLLSSLSVGAQSRPSAREAGLPLSVGFGYSNYNIDFDNFKRSAEESPRMGGLSAWIDLDLSGLRFVPNGLGIEAKGDSIRYGRPQDYSEMSQTAALAGPIYHWRRRSALHPYGKFLLGYGRTYFPARYGKWVGPYHFDTRTVYAPGGGVDLHAYGPLWVRADYEYQMWPQLFGRTVTPNGFTLGVSYDLSHRYLR
jgi:opacity protein-like surface antigen